VPDGKYQANGRLFIFYSTEFAYNIILEKFPSGIVILIICFIFPDKIEYLNLFLGASKFGVSTSFPQAAGNLNL
jgi:hypothetical protein